MQPRINMKYQLISDPIFYNGPLDICFCFIKEYLVTDIHRIYFIGAYVTECSIFSALLSQLPEYYICIKGRQLCRTTNKTLF